jgi:hypothetical protein
MSDELKEAEQRGYDKAVEMLRSSDAFYYWVAQKQYLNNIQWSYWLMIKKEDALKETRNSNE